MLDTIDPEMIQDLEGAKKAIVLLLNLFEEQQQEIKRLKEERFSELLWGIEVVE